MEWSAIVPITLWEVIIEKWDLRSEKGEVKIENWDLWNEKKEEDLKIENDNGNYTLK